MPRFVRRMTLRLAYPALLSSPLVPLTFWPQYFHRRAGRVLRLALMAARPAGEARPPQVLQISPQPTPVQISLSLGARELTTGGSVAFTSEELYSGDNPAIIASAQAENRLAECLPFVRRKRLENKLTATELLKAALQENSPDSL